MSNKYTSVFFAHTNFALKWGNKTNENELKVNLTYAQKTVC